MKNPQIIRTMEQYDSLSEKQLLRMVYASQLHQIQQIGQILTIVQTLVDLMAIHLSTEDMHKLAAVEFDSDPIPAIQRKIEEVWQELEDDLRNGVYDTGL